MTCPLTPAKDFTAYIISYTLTPVKVFGSWTTKIPATALPYMYSKLIMSHTEQLEVIQVSKDVANPQM